MVVSATRPIRNKLPIFLRSISRLRWNREQYNFEVRRSTVGNIRRKPVLSYANTVCGIAGVGEFSEPISIKFLDCH